jgi:hypothetical protein
VQSHAVKSQAHTAQLQQQFTHLAAKQHLFSQHHLEVQLIKKYEYQEPSPNQQMSRLLQPCTHTSYGTHFLQLLR